MRELSRSARGIRIAFLVVPILLLSISPMFSDQIPVPKPASAASMPSSSLWLGVGEDYELAWTYQAVPSNLTTAWESYYTNSTFQSLSAKFGWNVIRLGFRFGLACQGSQTIGCSQEQFLNVSNFANLDLAISMAASHGFKVILDDFDYQQGFYGSPAWYADWNATALHYQGNSNILFFEVANEMAVSNSGNNNDGCGSVGTYAIVCLDKLTSDIQQIDPNRAVAWWEYSVPNFPSVPPSNELRPNVYVDSHLGDYLNSTSCKSLSSFENEVNGLLPFVNKSGIPIIAGELNMQIVPCESVGSQDMQYLVDNNVSWVAWGFKTFFTKWVPILDSVNAKTTSSTTSTTTTTTTSSTMSTSTTNTSSATSTSQSTKTTSTLTTTRTSPIATSSSTTTLNGSQANSVETTETSQTSQSIQTTQSNQTGLTTSVQTSQTNSTTKQETATTDTESVLITTSDPSQPNISKVSNSFQIFGSLPSLAYLTSPIGTTLLGFVIGSITVAPFVVRRVAAKRIQKDLKESHRWRW